MKGYWIRREDSENCLLFMAGWAMGPEPFAEVDFGPTDVLMLYDYRALDMNQADLAGLAQSKKLHLLAWSMGVWAAAWLAQPGHIFSKLSFKSATAIGGTLRPCDDQHGIPERDFAKMLDGLSPTGVEAFYRAMFDQQEHGQRFLRCRPQRACKELHEELTCLRELCSSQTEVPPDIYSRHIVTSRDRIFPARSQLRAWGGRKRCLAAALPHFPFYQQEGQELLSRPLHS